MMTPDRHRDEVEREPIERPTPDEYADDPVPFSPTGGIDALVRFGHGAADKTVSPAYADRPF